MTGWPFRRKSTAGDERLQTLLLQAHAGDANARNEIIETYTPFALRIASQAARRYIDKSRDDEYSVALMALNDAVDRFDPDRKTSFLSLAETIIRRRLIDYYRSQRAIQKRQAPWSDFEVTDDEDNVINYVELKASVDAHEKEEEQRERTQEIAEYAQSLAQFGLSFNDLVELSPKHVDARRGAIGIAKSIVAEPALLQHVHDKKSLPLKALEERVSVSRKTLERQRKYIIAVVVLLAGDYPHLQRFMS